MKKFYAKNFAYGAAALLVGAVGLTGCSSDDELTNVNPTYDGESVKTQFAINIPYAGGNGTRVSQAIVQGQNPPTFRGMTNIRLVPFALGSGAIEGTTTTSIQPIALGAIGKNDLQTNGNYKVYNDVDIPVGVNNFLFYGEATDQTDDTSDKTNGALIPSYEVGGWPLDQTVDKITFSLKPILGTGSVESSQKTLAQMLTDIAGVSSTGGTKWSEVDNGDLKTYYTNFTSLKAGSANSIKAALQELYNSVKSKDVTDVDGLKDAIAKEITTTYFDETQQSDGTYTLEWKSSIDPAVKTFPNNLGLPDGSQQLTFSAPDFSYVNPATVQNGNILQQTAYDKYVYPASLFYTVNTDIKVADKAMTEGGVYQGTFGDWNDILGLQGFADGKVTNTTQSIALVNPIQYAVASLNLFVRFADTYIYDNGDKWPIGAPIGQIAVPIPNAGFPLTGVLVGGQKPVKWDFTTTDTQDNAAWTIYDASMGSAVVKKASAYETTPTAYTLALETKGVSAGAGEGEKVRIALEMTNDSGADFVGADGIVPAGGKFYLVGELVSSTAVGTDGDGSSLKVFEQDHKTIARVTINSLKSAYNCIPDLRSPKLELGLSVDLTWQQGLVSDVTIK